MKETRERILEVALRLFSRRGYDAVSMRDIAGQLGITQGAVYRHYAGKQALFDCILERMAEADRKQAEAGRVPAAPVETDPGAYRRTSRSDLAAFTLAMFRHWTEDRFASAFRRLLTLEQFRSAKLSALYQQYLGSGVLSYVTDIFRGQGVPAPEGAALRFYAPFYFLLNQYDAGKDKPAILAKLKQHLEDFHA